jgi:hypothetical protein
VYLILRLCISTLSRPPGLPLKTKEPPKRANWLSRRHSCASISGGITSTDDNLCFRHAYRPDELVESGGV